MLNFFKRQYQFSEVECTDELRFRLLSYGLILSIVLAYTVLIMMFTNILPRPVFIVYLDLFLGTVSIILFVLLHSKRVHYILILCGFLIIIYVVALLLNTQGSLDSLRLLWFSLLLVVGFLIGNVWIGILISVLVAFTVVMLFSTIFGFSNKIAFLNFIEVQVVLTTLLTIYTKQTNNYANKLKEQNILLNKLASIDVLTGIYNRRFLFELADKYLEKAKREHRSYTLMAMDIDHFKNVNDTYGHHIGDNALQAFVHTVKSMLREGDLFGRTGGEEFTVILMDSDPKNSYIVAEKIRTEVEKIICDIHEIHMTVSIGIAFLEEDDTLEDIMIRADKCLYTAKKNGRNQVVTQVDI